MQQAALAGIAGWILCGIAFADAPQQVDFRTQVIPILTKSGCNAGACHGAAAGRGGFRLSLFGQDPWADYERIVLELNHRRVDLANPQRSLLLRKPGGLLEHEGGLRLDLDGGDGAVVRRWIEQGCAPPAELEISSLVVQPSSLILNSDSLIDDLPASPLKLTATATLSDGSTRDVTALSLFTPGDAAAIDFSAEVPGRFFVRRRGRHTTIVRFADKVAVCEVLVPYGSDTSQPPATDHPVDRYIDARLADIGLRPGPVASDATLVRRLYLDLLGRLPSIEQTRRYVADPAPDKRQKLVDQLIESEHFSNYWSYLLAHHLRLTVPGRGAGREIEVASAYRGWLAAQLRQNRGLDAIIRALITSTGDSHSVGPAGFYRAAGDPRSQAELAAEALMGVRLRCANCHNHPLDVWTQDDYHGLAALFSGMSHGRHVRWQQARPVAHPATRAAALPKLPGSATLDAAGDHRSAFAQWLTAPDNAYFGPVWANRVWAALMRRGLFEPLDDYRATNPPTHPELLDWLAQDWSQHDYDLRHLVRTVCTSAAYSRSAPAAASDSVATTRIATTWYAVAGARRLRPEVVHDAIRDVLDVHESFPQWPGIYRAVSIPDPLTPSQALSDLGRCEFETGCTTRTGSSVGVAEALALINGDSLNDLLRNDQGRLSRWTAAGREAREIVSDFYLLCFARPPRPEEDVFWATELAKADSTTAKQKILEDMLWSMLTCQEFVTNH